MKDPGSEVGCNLGPALIFGLFFDHSDCFFDYSRLCVTSTWFSHHKSIPYLFLTLQARTQQQTEILIHLVKKLALVNDNSGVLYLVDPVILFHKYGKNFSSRVAAHAPTKC